MQKGDRAADKAHTGTLRDGFSCPFLWKFCSPEFTPAGSVSSWRVPGNQQQLPHPAESNSASSPPDLLPTLNSYSRSAPAARSALCCKLTLYPFSLHERCAGSHQYIFSHILSEWVPCCRPGSACSFVCFILPKVKRNAAPAEISAPQALDFILQLMWATNPWEQPILGSNLVLYSTKYRSTKDKAAAGFLSCFPLFLER